MATEDTEHRLTVLETNYTYIKLELENLDKKIDQKFGEVRDQLTRMEDTRKNNRKFHITIIVSVVSAVIISLASLLSRLL